MPTAPANLLVNPVLKIMLASWKVGGAHGCNAGCCPFARAGAGDNDAVLMLLKDMGTQISALEVRVSLIVPAIPGPGLHKTLVPYSMSPRAVVPLTPATCVNGYGTCRVTWY